MDTTSLYGTVQGKRLQRAQETVRDILTVLVKRAKGNRVSIGIRQIAEQISATEVTVKKWINRLLSLGLIRKTREGVWQYRTAEYDVTTSAREMVSHSLYIARPSDAGMYVSVSLSEVQDRNKTDCLSDTLPDIQEHNNIHSFDASASLVLVNEIPSTPDNSVRPQTDWARLRRQSRREDNIRRANRLLAKLWEQVSTGQSRYPVHPDFLRVVKMSDADRDRYERETGYPPEDRFFVFAPEDKYHCAVRPRLRRQYRYLVQPDVKDRPRCKVCGRSMYLTVLTAPLGAIKYVCKNVKGHGVPDGLGFGVYTFRDLWWQYRVFNNGEQSAPEVEDVVPCAV